jgi:hypothetical protein
MGEVSICAQEAGSVHRLSRGIRDRMHRRTQGETGEALHGHPAGMG